MPPHVQLLATSQFWLGLSKILGQAARSLTWAAPAADVSNDHGPTTEATLRPGSDCCSCCTQAGQVIRCTSCLMCCWQHHYIVHSSYKRVKGRSHTVEKRKASQPQKPHATSQPSRFSHTPTLSTVHSTCPPLCAGALWPPLRTGIARASATGHSPPGSGVVASLAACPICFFKFFLVHQHWLCPSQCQVFGAFSV